MTRIGRMHATLTRCLRSFGILSSPCTLLIFSGNSTRRYVRFWSPYTVKFLTHTRQFRERYKGFKIPLDSLSNSNYSLVKKLGAAGTRIKAHISQADALKPLKAMIEFTNDPSSVAESSGAAMDEGEQGEIAAAKGKKSRSAKVHDEKELLEALAGEEVMDGLDVGTSRVARKADAPETKTRLIGKFVNVTDLIPPLPDKGSFEVEDIKKSQYFFS